MAWKRGERLVCLELTQGVCSSYRQCDCGSCYYFVSKSAENELVLELKGNRSMRLCSFPLVNVPSVALGEVSSDTHVMLPCGTRESALVFCYVFLTGTIRGGSVLGLVVFR